MDKGEWEKGLAYLDKAIEITDLNDREELANYYERAALCLVKLNKLDQAFEYCEKAIYNNSIEVNAYILKGRILIEQDHQEEGLAEWKKSIKISSDATTWSQIGMASLETGNTEIAIKTLEHAYELEPELEGVCENLAFAYLMQKDVENFVKFNSLSRRPINLEDLSQIGSESNIAGFGDFSGYIEEVIKSINKDKN